MVDVMELRELLAKATPGPWAQGPCASADGTRIASYDVHLPVEPGDVGVAVLASYWGGQANAELTVAAVNALPQLLAALDEAARMRERVERVRDWLFSIAEIDMDEIVADGGITAAMVVQQEAREQARRLARASLSTEMNSEPEKVG
jgi:Ser/Thr protein kinase RdoA (MazF antagonist)